LTEWKSCGNSSDLDKLALADSALISWLAQNLMKLNEKQLIETVSAILYMHLIFSSRAKIEVTDHRSQNTAFCDL